MVTINVARDFTRAPGGRFEKSGPFSGELFRKKLVEALRDANLVVVELDGTYGYGSSFLEEAFGGLVRVEKIPATILLARLQLKTVDTGLLDEIKKYVEKAGAR